MAQPQHRSKDNLQQSEYWMRTVSFAGLHRILKAVADFPTGLRASEINNLVLKNKISLTRRNSPPSPTTLHLLPFTTIGIPCYTYAHSNEMDGSSPIFS